MSSATPIACALAELNVSHERVKVDIRTGEQRRPNWLGHGFGVERGQWPVGGTPEALQALSWCAWAYVTYGSVVSRLHVATQGDEALRSPTHAKAATQALSDLLAVLDARLATRPWMLGVNNSLVDLVVGSVWATACSWGTRECAPARAGLAD